MAYRIANTRDEHRRRDTRRKIAFGGLILKAGLDTTDEAVILGILVDGERKLASRADYEHFKRLGQAAFGQADPDPTQPDKDR